MQPSCATSAHRTCVPGAKVRFPAEIMSQEDNQLPRDRHQVTDSRAPVSANTFGGGYSARLISRRGLRGQAGAARVDPVNAQKQVPVYARLDASVQPWPR
jgi:hypothetical protein